MCGYGREGACGGTVGSYRTLSEHSKRITCPQAAPNKNNQSQDWLFLFGGRRWIRTIEVSDNRFTVCPLWPLGKSSTLELVIGIEPTTC